MDGYDATTYGDGIAEMYDKWISAGSQDAQLDAAVSFLAGHARAGRALELGIGTGRIALPLAERGIKVHGIEASERMVEKLREKPGAEDLPVTVGDFADVAAPGPFDLVFVVTNTLFNLTTQEDQLRCLQNSAQQLSPGGVLVVEALVPDVTRFDRDQRVQVGQIEVGRVRLDVSRHDRVSQTVTSQHLVVDAEGTRLYPVQTRYVWPAELDLMCRLAGLFRIARTGGWQGEPFSAASPRHVSVYGRSASAS
ncbi:class I SAM-dependent DNA methyltransferase [Micromonospora sp. LOL_023]|uniref:class I SAM-dependent DNA methyltransferase n=1 Tax=Micromonospora sp. LOL_023 TaxID=3345418 RepID=UPI003A86902C